MVLLWISVVHSDSTHNLKTVSTLRKCTTADPAFLVPLSFKLVISQNMSYMTAVLLSAHTRQGVCLTLTVSGPGRRVRGCVLLSDESCDLLLEGTSRVRVVIRVFGHWSAGCRSDIFGVQCRRILDYSRLFSSSDSSVTSPAGFSLVLRSPFTQTLRVYLVLLGYLYEWTWILRYPFH